MFELRNLTKHYGDVTALDHVNLDIPDNKMTGVIGPSGAGKSTLLRLLNRMSAPSGGTMRFDAVPVSELKGRALRTWRRSCAMVFQHFNLVDRLDVLTNVLLGRLGYDGTLPTLLKRFSAADREMAVRALERLGMAAYALKRAGDLSGGQQQRVAIARALVQEPKLVLADEPIASLDPRNSTLVMDALRRINREDGITVICNLHQVAVAREYCDHIIGVSAGHVVYEGSPDGLSDECIRSLYAIDADDDEWAEAACAAAPETPSLAGRAAANA